MTTDEKVDLLISLFKEFKADVNRRFDEQDKKFVDVNRRFDEQDKRFDDVNRRFDEQDKRTDRLENNQREDHSLLMDIWKSRDKVQAQVTWDFIWKAVAINAIILFGILGATGQFVLLH